MDYTKKIIFTGEDQGVSEVIDKLGRSAESLARGLIADARAYTTSGKEVLSYIEQQILSIERRGRLDRQQREFELGKRREEEIEARKGVGVAGVEKRYVAGMAEIKKGSEEDKLQIHLLRELIETTKQTAREEVRSGRTNVEDQIRHSKTVNQLGLDEQEDEFDALKQTLQQQYLGDVKQKEREQKERFGVGKTVEGVIGTAAGLIVSKNEIYALAGLLAMIPFVGAGLSMIGTKLLTAAEGYETALGGMVGIAGGTMGRYEGVGKVAKMYGVTMEEFLVQAAGISRARGMATGYERTTIDFIETMKGLSLQQSDLLGLERLRRGDISGMSSRENIEYLIKGLQSAGVVKGTDTSLLPEYLQLLVQYSHEQLVRLGSVDTGINIRMISSLANLDETLANPDVLRGVVQGMNAGLLRPSTPQMEALQFATLSAISPGSSFWELKRMQEEGLSREGYMEGILNRLKAISYNDEMFYMNIQGAFGFSAKISEAIGKGFLEGKFRDYSEMKNEIKRQYGVDIADRATSATSEMAKATAGLSNVFAEQGKNLVDAMSGLVDKIDEWIDKIAQTAGPSVPATKLSKETAQELTKSLPTSIVVSPVQFQIWNKILSVTEKIGRNTEKDIKNNKVK